MTPPNFAPDAVVVPTNILHPLTPLTDLTCLSVAGAWHLPLPLPPPPPSPAKKERKMRERKQEKKSKERKRKKEGVRMVRGLKAVLKLTFFSHLIKKNLVNGDTSRLPQRLLFIMGNRVNQQKQLLITVPKSFSARSQVLLNDVCYQKYRHRHHHWQIPCQNVVVATRRCQPLLSCAFLKFDGGKYSSLFRSKMFNCVLLILSI